MKFNSSRIFMHGVNWNLLPPAKLIAYVQNYPCIEHVARGKGSLGVEEGGGGLHPLLETNFFLHTITYRKKIMTVRSLHGLYQVFFLFYSHTRTLHNTPGLGKNILYIFFSLSKFLKNPLPLQYVGYHYLHVTSFKISQKIKKFGIK